MLENKSIEVLILGAGGAGLMCAATAAKRGRQTLVLDHSEKLGKKILISGGGRCNFTNINASAKTYYSENEHFAKSALARFTPEDFLALIKKHRIAYHEKKLGQLFCDESAQSIVDLLQNECKEAGAEILLGCRILSVRRIEQGSARFLVETTKGNFAAESLVVATGGPSIPKIGATDFGQRLARELGLALTKLDPALVSLTMDAEFLKDFGDLSGVSVDCDVSLGKILFRENILFTHTGLSGPAILQISLYWHEGEAIKINLTPGHNLAEFLLEKKRAGIRTELKNSLGDFFTKRLADRLVEVFFGNDSTPLAQISDQRLREFALQLQGWELRPVGTGGYGKAEVTRGGVDTKELSSKTLECKKIPGLYFIGEVVDITGRLGGYNFQWAWASGVAAGESV